MNFQPKRKTNFKYDGKHTNSKPDFLFYDCIKF